MLKTTKSTTVNGQVFIENKAKTGDATENKQVAYLNATIYEDGNVNINKSIQDTETFNANKTEVLEDFTSFETYVYGLMDGDSEPVSE